MFNSFNMLNGLSQKQVILDELESGVELTSDEIIDLVGAGNPYAIIHTLRQEGYPIYLNNRPDRLKAYRLGTPSKSLIAAGYRALAAGL